MTSRPDRGSCCHDITYLSLTLYSCPMAGGRNYCGMDGSGLRSLMVPCYRCASSILAVLISTLALLCGRRRQLRRRRLHAAGRRQLRGRRGRGRLWGRRGRLWGRRERGRRRLRRRRPLWRPEQCAAEHRRVPGRWLGGLRHLSSNFWVCGAQSLRHLGLAEGGQGIRVRGSLESSQTQATWWPEAVRFLKPRGLTSVHDGR